MTDDHLLTLEEVADYVGVHVRTVRRWVHAGHLVAVRLSKSYRIEPADLRRFLDERKPPPGAPL